MSKRPRVRRPEPERTQPVRNWRLLFGPANPRPGAPSPMEGFVRRGVEAGHQVVEEYLRRERRWERPPVGPVSAGPSVGQGGAQVLEVVQRGLWDLAGLWMDFAGSGGGRGFVAGAPELTPATGEAGPFWPAERPASQGGARVEAPSALFQQKLAAYGGAARERMREYLDGLPFQDGLRELVADYPERGGRSLRASLCMATARAFGASASEALNSAVALELLHNAFLVHDDVEDESQERRGRPTLYRSHGAPMAINAGDALAVLSLRPLIDNFGVLGPRLSLRILEEAQRMAQESVEGQFLELWWRQRNASHLTEGDYLRMVMKKTCWYTIIYPLRVGALIGSRGSADLEPSLRFGFFVGAAFQIQDDLLNLVGDEARYGKERNGDLWEGKRTLMLIHLLGAAEPEERARLLRLLEAPRAVRAEADIRWIRALMERYGSIEHARQVAQELAQAAQREFPHAYGALRDSPDKQFIEQLPLWVLHRE